MGVVYGLCSGLFTEVVDHAVHGVLIAEELHRRALPVEHAERFLAEVRDVPALRLLHSGGVQELWRFADPVHPEGCHLLVLV